MDLPSSKRSRDESSLDDSEKRKRAHTVWGGLCSALAEDPDFDPDQLPATTYRQWFRYLEKMSSTSSLFDLIAVMRTIPWPAAKEEAKQEALTEEEEKQQRTAEEEEKRKGWVNLVNSPTLDALLKAFCSIEHVHDVMQAFGMLRGHSKAVDQMIEYFQFVRSILQSSNEDAFDFICDRGVDVARLPAHMVCKAAFAGSSVKILKHVMQKTGANESWEFYLRFVQHPAVADYLLSIDREIGKEKMLLAMAQGRWEYHQFLAHLIGQGLPFSWFDGKQVTMNWLEKMEAQGIFFPRSTVTSWANRAISSGDCDLLQQLIVLGPDGSRLLPATTHDIYKILKTTEQELTAGDIERICKTIIRKCDMPWLEEFAHDHQNLPSAAIRAIFAMKDRGDTGWSNRPPHHTLRRMLKLLLSKGVVPPPGLQAEFGEEKGFKSLLDLLP